MRPILVVAAWAPELASLPKLPGVVSRVVGVGLVEAAAGAARALAEVAPRTLILVGTAGLLPGVRPAPALGSAIVARKIVLASHAVARGEAFLPGPMPSRVSCAVPLRRSLGGRALDVACPVAITATRAGARRLAEATSAALENLEAFAVARAAGDVPFAAVLGVANHVGPLGHAQWRAHGAAAAAAACARVAAWLARAKNVSR